MGYLDYSLPDVVDYSKGIEKFGDALTEVMRRRQQEQQHNQDLEFQREQEARKLKQAQMNIDYQNRIIDQREKRDQREFSQRQNVYRSQQAERARHAASPQEAEAILNETELYDPATGAPLGRGKLTPGPMRDIGPAPQQPQAPAFPSKESAAVIPDIAQAVPGMPPELAAVMRGKKRLPNISLMDPNDNQSDPEAAAAHKAFLDEMDRTRGERKGKLFVDQINDDGIATLLDDQGNKTHVPAQKGWAEGGFVTPDGKPAEVSMRRFEPEAQPDRFQAAADAYQGYQGKQREYEAASQAFPGQQAAYAAEQRRAEAERPYTISFPTASGDQGPGTTFDFKTQRYAAGEMAAQQFIDSLPPNMTPDQQQAARETVAAIKSGVDPQKAQAEFARTLRLGREQGFKGEQGDLERQNRLDVQRLRNQAPRPAITVGQGNLDMRQFEQFQKDAERFAKRYGVSNDINGLKQLTDAVNGIGGDNAALQRGVSFQLVRSMQGSGPVTDQDIRQIRRLVAGAGGALETWLSQADNGTLGPEEQKVLFDAVKIRLGGIKARMQQARSEADKHFLRANSPYRHWVGDDFIQSELDAMFPGTVSTVDFSAPTSGGPPEVNARRRGKGKKSAPKSKLDEAME